MSTTLTTKTTIKQAAKPPFRTTRGEMVPQDGIVDIEGSGFAEADEKGNFSSVPLEQRRRPSHPGAILRELYLPPTGLTQGEFADKIGVSRRTVSLIVNEKMPVSVDMAHRLARAFGTSVQLWLGLQHARDVWDALQTPAQQYEQIEKLERRAA